MTPIAFKSQLADLVSWPLVPTYLAHSYLILLQALVSLILERKRILAIYIEQDCWRREKSPALGGSREKRSRKGQKKKEGCVLCPVGLLKTENEDCVLCFVGLLRKEKWRKERDARQIWVLLTSHLGMKSWGF